METVSGTVKLIPRFQCELSRSAGQTTFPLEAWDHHSADIATGMAAASVARVRSRAMAPSPSTAGRAAAGLATPVGEKAEEADANEATGKT